MALRIAFTAVIVGTANAVSVQAVAVNVVLGVVFTGALLFALWVAP